MHRCSREIHLLDCNVCCIRSCNGIQSIPSNGDYADGQIAHYHVQCILMWMKDKKVQLLKDSTAAQSIHRNSTIKMTFQKRSHAIAFATWLSILSVSFSRKRLHVCCMLNWKFSMACLLTSLHTIHPQPKCTFAELNRLDYESKQCTTNNLTGKRASFECTAQPPTIHLECIQKSMHQWTNISVISSRRCESLINLHCMHIIMQLDIWFNASCWLLWHSNATLRSSHRLHQLHVVIIVCKSGAFCSVTRKWQVGLRSVSWMNNFNVVPCCEMNGFECYYRHGIVSRIGNTSC